MEYPTKKPSYLSDAEPNLEQKSRREIASGHKNMAGWIFPKSSMNGGL